MHELTLNSTNSASSRRGLRLPAPGRLPVVCPGARGTAPWWPSQSGWTWDFGDQTSNIIKQISFRKAKMIIWNLMDGSRILTYSTAFFFDLFEMRWVHSFTSFTPLKKHWAGNQQTTKFLRLSLGEYRFKSNGNLQSQSSPIWTWFKGIVAGQRRPEE